MINQLQQFTQHPQTLSPQLLTKLVSQYNEAEQQQQVIILQVIIQGLIYKKYNHDTLQSIQPISQNNQILFFVYLSILYKQKNKCNTVQQQQSINKLINLSEEHFKNIVHHLQLDSVLIKIITKCVVINPQLFRNHQKQIQELCIQQRTQESCDLYAVLQFTYLEGKQGTNSYQSQITNTIEQLIDAFYVLTSLVDLDRDKVALYTHWQNTLITEEFKMNLLHIEGKNAKTKFSLIFQLVKQLLNNYDEITYFETIKFILQLLQSQLSFIKEDIVIDIQIDSAIQRIGDVLQLNNCFDDHLVSVYETQHIQNIMQQLQNKLNKMMIDRNINLNIEQYKELNQSIKSSSLELLCLLIKSSFGQGLIINTSLLQILLKFTQSSFSVNSKLICQFTQLYQQMDKLNFLTTRLEIELTSRLLEQLELEFPKFMKNMNTYLKSERHQIYNKSQKLKPQQKDIQLGLLPQDQLNKQTVRLLRNRFQLQFNALSLITQNNLKRGNSFELIKRLYQFLFTVFAFPHDLLINYLQSEAIQQLLQLCRIVLINFNEVDICIVQPIKYFVSYLESSELYSVDLCLQDSAQGLSEMIDSLKKKTLQVDNFVSTMKSLNDQFSKTQQIFQSEEQYYSCNNNPMDQSLNNSNGNNANLQNVAAQIRKTHSFIGEEESSSKQNEQNEMFYSVVNPVDSKHEQAPKITTTIESKPDDEEFEMPKVVFD